MRSVSRRFSLQASLCLAAFGTTADGGVIHVDDSATGAATGATWADAYPRLQDALAAASAGDQIWVAEGTYLPSDTGDVTASFVLKDGVEVYGGFLGSETSVEDRAGSFEQTVLSGTLGPGTLKSNHVVLAVGLSSGAVIDGFLVFGGQARTSDVVPGVVGGGGLLASGSKLEIRNIEFRLNRAFSQSSFKKSCGAAAYVDGGDVEFASCAFEDNLARGADEDSSGTAGAGYGGAVYQSGGATAFHRCSFWKNRVVGGNFTKAVGMPGDAFGGAVAVVDGAAVFRECRFGRNECQGGIEPFFPWVGFAAGGGVAAQGGVTFEHCVFTRNTVKAIPWGSPTSVGATGGAVLARGDVVMTQCTIYDNTADITGGIFCESGSVRLFNSVVYAHGPQEQDQLGSGAGASWFVSHSDVEGWTGSLGGDGNTGADPNFVNPPGPDGALGTEDDDFQLGPGSPCVDAGNNALAPKDALDLDGDGDVTEPVPFDLFGAPRFSDDPTKTDTGAGIVPVVDMGALERQGDFCQWNMGFQGPGDLQISLCGEPLTAVGNVATFSLQGAPPSSPVLLFASTIAQPTPAAGGILVPVPPLLVLGLASDSGGVLTFHVPGANGPPATVYLQAVSPGAPVEISNALEIVTGT